jgi:hypothetical protein
MKIQIKVLMVSTKINFFLKEKNNKKFIILGSTGSEGPKGKGNKLKIKF